MDSTSFQYEFGGPVGASLTIVILPIVVLLLAHWSFVGYLDLSVLKLRETVTSPWWCPSCDDSSHLVFCGSIIVGWFFFLVVLERLLPGPWVNGAPLPGGKALSYRINGHLSFWITLLVAFAGWPVHDGERWQLSAFPHWSFLYENFATLAFCTTFLSFALSIYLYLSSFFKDSDGNGKILAAGGNSGIAAYDFWMGRELNPRIGSFDLKEFCELRPGLIGWMLLNAAAAYQQKHEMGYITGSMLLVNVFHGVYIWDALFQERAILTTMDITTDGFGFMLCFGDLTWVPFTYSIQSRYLVRHDPNLSLWQLLGILALHGLGYWIFRSANGQKDAYRRNHEDPAVAHLRYMSTKRGTRLLVSGWWGWARKINYTGDFIMGLSWCLLCGFNSLVPYYYAVYFAVLLIHRAGRDDHLCRQKYGPDWDEYKRIVKYQFIPGIF